MKKRSKEQIQNEQWSDNFARSNREKSNIASAIFKDNNLRALKLFIILGAPILFLSTILSTLKGSQ